MSEAPKLKPCPFCGGDALRQDVGEAWIRCKCGAEGPGASSGSRRAGRELWNTRTDAITPAQAAKVLLGALSDGTDEFRSAINAMTPHVRADFDASAWLSVSETADALRAALRAIAQEDKQ